MGRKAAEKWKARFGADWKLRRGEMRAARDAGRVEEVRLEQGVEARARRAKQTEAAWSDAAAVTVGMFKRRGD